MISRSLCFKLRYFHDWPIIIYAPDEFKFGVIFRPTVKYELKLFNGCRSRGRIESVMVPDPVPWLGF